MFRCAFRRPPRGYVLKFLTPVGRQGPRPRTQYELVPGIRFSSSKEEDNSSVLDKSLKLAPGIAVSGAVMGSGFFVADQLGSALMAAQGVTMSSSPISGIPVAIILGLLLNNTMKLPESLKAGLKACTTTVLRAGIVCVGFKLSVMDVINLGVAGIPAVIASVGAGLLFVPWFGRKMGLSPKMGYLIAAGTSICGVTAITAVAPVIKANEKDVAFAVANVVAFGTFGMLAYPYFAHWMFSSSEQVGMFLGLAIHDTSQVIGSALTYKEVYGDELALKVAAITKLMRNLFLIGVIPGLGWLESRSSAAADAKVAITFADVKKHVPTFVLGFAAMSALRTAGDASLASSDAALGLLDAAQWESLTKFVGNNLGSQLFLGTAMAAVGLSTSKNSLKGVGARPFVVGLSASMVVGSTGLAMALLCG